MSREGFVFSPVGELFYEVKGVTGDTPLVAVHGGPGFTSHYLEPLFDLGDLLPVVRYDQAGCGRARRAGARQSFSIGGFVQELEALRGALGVSNMHLFGHSFGGAIVGEYALAYPQHVQSVVFACSSLDIPRWLEDAERLLSQMPLMQRMILREGLRTGASNAPEFQQALAYYYRKHVYGCSEKPECLVRSEMESDPLTYNAVWGPHELTVTGTARQYSIVSRLHELQCPTLFMCGRFDEATPEAHQFFASCVSGSQCHIFEHSAHHPQLTERDECISVLRSFVSSTVSSQ
jgi:proline iminopeptidase